ncbi:MAG: TfpX/TfpZ family type IV pilin accessory protein [Rhodanobacteraceae bacterium]
MSRWKAAGIHLSISLAIGLIVGALLFGVWYPPPFFHAAGADQLVLLMVSVDIVLGPLLTLVVFKSGKRGLKFDLVLIGAVQSIALVYGLSIVLRSRPVFLVAVVDRFALVSAGDIDDDDLALGSKPQFRQRSWTGPMTVGARLPPLGKARTAIMFSSLKGKDVDAMPKYFVDYPAVAPDLLKKAKPIDELPKRDPEATALLDAAFRKSGTFAQGVVWVPVTALKANMIMLLDAQTGKPIRAVAINPWPN